MQRSLDRLGIPLRVVRAPKPENDRHGEILSDSLLIYDEAEEEAWETFEHGVYEYKFKEVTHTYRAVINGLIDAVEKLTYERKESFLEFLSRVSEVIRQEKGSARP